MADVLALLGAVLALVIVFPGIIIAWRQLFPATVECARLRLDRTPWRCFWLGCITTFILLSPVVTLLALPLELTRLVGCSLFFIVLAFAGLGAAGLAAMIGGRLVPHASNSISPTATSVPGAIALELAAGFWLGGVATVILLPPIVILLDLPFTLAWPVGLRREAYSWRRTPATAYPPPLHSCVAPLRLNWQSAFPSSVGLSSSRLPS